MIFLNLKIMIKAYFKSYQQNNFAKSVNLPKFAENLT